MPLLETSLIRRISRPDHDPFVQPSPTAGTVATSKQEGEQVPASATSPKTSKPSACEATT